MKYFFALILANVAMIGCSAYDLNLQLKVDSPADDNCGLDDQIAILVGLEEGLQELSNKFLKNKGLDGATVSQIIIDADLSNVPAGRLLAEDAAEEIEVHRQLLLSWNYQVSGGCNYCPPDNGDHRRRLGNGNGNGNNGNGNGVGNEFSIAKMMNFVNGRIPKTLKKLVKGELSASCTVDEWSITFEKAL